MTEIIKKIANTKDDATENETWCYWEFTADEVYLEPDWAYYGAAGVRFQLNIPQGAIIDSAILSLYIAWASDADFNIFGHAIDESENFEDNNYILSEVHRPRTTNSVFLTGNYPDAGYINLPDIKDIIQEIISRPGWVANNHLTLLMIPAGVLYKYSAFEDFSYGPTGEFAAYVTINYHVPPIYHPKKKAFSGYHCFMEQYIKNIEAGAQAYKLPDDTLW